MKFTCTLGVTFAWWSNPTVQHFFPIQVYSLSLGVTFAWWSNPTVKHFFPIQVYSHKRKLEPGPVIISCRDITSITSCSRWFSNDFYKRSMIVDGNMVLSVFLVCLQRSGLWWPLAVFLQYVRNYRKSVTFKKSIEITKYMTLCCYTTVLIEVH